MAVLLHIMVEGAATAATYEPSFLLSAAIRLLFSGRTRY